MIIRAAGVALLVLPLVAAVDLAVCPKFAPPISSDGRCTGFVDALGPWNWHDCCWNHDHGGTDRQFAACMNERLPWVIQPVVYEAIGVMVIARPAYMQMQTMGWSE